MINLSTGAFYERGTRQIALLRGRAEGLQKQIGTGERLERASDDPVAAAKLRDLARSERLSEVAARNADMASADLTLTDQTLGAAAGIVIRVRELAVQAAGATLTPAQRATLGEEIAGLRSSLLQLANGRGVAGGPLFGGQGTGAAYADAPPGATYQGSDRVAPVDIGDGQTVVPGLTGPEVFAWNGAAGATDAFTVLGDLAAALRAGDAGAGAFAQASLDLLDAGLEKVTTAQTVVGARLNWIDLNAGRRADAGERRAAERAEVGGADIAVTMTRLQETLTVLEASQASFVRLANLSLFSLLR